MAGAEDENNVSVTCVNLIYVFLLTLIKYLLNTLTDFLLSVLNLQLHVDIIYETFALFFYYK